MGGWGVRRSLACFVRVIPGGAGERGVGVGGGQAEARGEGRGGRVEDEGHKLIEGVSHKSSMSTCHL